MRIGFTSLYAWRPHVEHLHFLANLARTAGHEAFFLACDSDLPSCYTRELRPERSGWLSCLTCRVGGIRSYESRNVVSIGDLRGGATTAPAPAADWVRSSVNTLGRYETDQEFASPDYTARVRRLEPAGRLAYEAARRWIDRERLDAVVLFNGRMDATRAVQEAALAAGVRFVSMERTWFGDGLQLLPDESCLGLRTVDAMMTEWRDAPLLREQALRAAGHSASRFLRRNTKEWRAYNTAASITPWPRRAERRILLVPGSRNEVLGHPDWRSRWPEPTAAYDALIDHLRLAPDELVLRCHPNWGESIAGVDGSMSERYFSDWARRRNIHVVASTDSTSTLGLIEQSEAIVVSGGSASLEAGMLGRQVIAVTASPYQQAGLQSTVYEPAQLATLQLDSSLDEVAAARARRSRMRQTLRFCHTTVYRVAQYVRHVRCLTTTRYAYLEGADPERLTTLLRSGRLQADDARSAADSREEDEVLAMVEARDWAGLYDAVPAAATDRLVALQRRWAFRPVDRLREALPRGDL